MKGAVTRHTELFRESMCGLGENPNFPMVVSLPTRPLCFSVVYVSLQIYNLV